jgi:hypothetical protein
MSHPKTEAWFNASKLRRSAGLAVGAASSESTNNGTRDSVML